MTSRPPHLAAVPDPEYGARSDPETVPAPLSEARLRQALIEAGHPSTAPDLPHLYPVARRSDAADRDDC